MIHSDISLFTHRFRNPIDIRALSSGSYGNLAGMKCHMTFLNTFR